MSLESLRLPYDRIPRPSALSAVSVAVAPLVGAALATFLIGINVFVAIPTLVAAFAPMMAASSYLLSLHVKPDRSPLWAELHMAFDTPKPRWLQRWYAPVLTASIAAGGSELLRATIPLVLAGLRPPAIVLAAYLLLGVLEGVFLVLVLALSWSLASLLWTLRMRKLLLSLSVEGSAGAPPAADSWLETDGPRQPTEKED